jgi:hypothetical protein
MTNNQRDYANALRDISAPIFAAVLKDELLTVHAAATPGWRNVKAEILTRVAGTRVRVRFHNPTDLQKPRSLEGLIRRLGDGAIMYDPTGSLTRAEWLIAAAHSVRASLGSKVKGVFYAPRLRTLFVALDADRIVVNTKVRVGELADIERQTALAVAQAFVNQPKDCPAVRIGFGLPTTELVPVDKHSVTGWGERTLSAMKRYWKPAAIAALSALGATTAAAKDPAVSETNLKLRGSVGSADDETAWSVNGGLTVPLGHSFGLQVEGGVGGADGDTIYGGAAHVFTRDPEQYLLGLFAAYAAETEFDLDAWRVGGEAEIYLNQVSILVAGGYQFSDNIGDKAFGDVELRWYITNDFALSGGGRFDDDRAVATVGAEWRPGFAALPGLAFHVDGAFGEDDYTSIMGGLTFYFGSDATLIDRHRRQDPRLVWEDLFDDIDNSARQNRFLLGPYGSN